MIKELENYIINNFGNENTMQNKLFGLFSVYSTYYVNDFESFRNSPKNFLAFLKENIDLLVKVCQVSEENILKCFKIFYRMIESKIASKYVYTEQNKYAEIVKNLSPSKNSRILDVGTGTVPFSSILLGRDMPNISAMDEYFWFSDESLKNMNVTALKEYFTPKTLIDNYDMIVGRAPCTAIDSIVYLCNKYKKPYFIETCECNVPSLDYFYRKWGISKSSPAKQPEWQEAMSSNFKWIVEDIDVDELDWMMGWQKTLPELDKNINFYGSYAYNVGESSENVEKLIMLSKIKAVKNLSL